MLSSGEVAKSTSSAAEVQLINNSSGVRVTQVNIVNEGAEKFFVSLENPGQGNRLWLYMPAGDPSSTPPKIAARTFTFTTPINLDLKMKRITNNASGVYADAY